jgi:hypothetical protein
MLSPDEIARLYDIHDITKNERTKIVCPLPDHKHYNYTPSFSIYFRGGKQNWFCHGCGRGGDVIDLVGYLNIPGYNSDDTEHIKRAIDILTDGKHSISPVIPPPQEPELIYQGEWKNYTPPGEVVMEYARNRGITPRVINMFQVGQMEKYGKIYMTLPCFHDGVLQGIKLRLVEGEGLRYHSFKGSKSGIFNYDGVKGQRGVIFVVKGEIAAMVMESNGYSACAPTNGECGDIEPFLPIFNLADRIVVISDNDPVESTRVQISKCAKQRAKVLSATLVYPPEEYKDIDEWLLADPEAAKNYLNSFLGGTNESRIYRWEAPNPKQPQRRWARPIRL